MGKPGGVACAHLVHEACSSAVVISTDAAYSEKDKPNRLRAIPTATCVRMAAAYAQRRGARCPRIGAYAWQMLLTGAPYLASWLTPAAAPVNSFTKELTSDPSGAGDTSFTCCCSVATVWARPLSAGQG